MDQTTLTSKWKFLNPLLDERARRTWAATEAVAIGRSGVTLVAEVTGLSRTTIHAGIKELQAIQQGKAHTPEEGDRLRAVGSGRKRLAQFSDLPQLSALKRADSFFAITTTSR